MHESVMDFLAGTIKNMQLADRRVLEVGAWDVNGSARQLFTGPYWGVDLIPGRGVDQRIDAHELVNGRRIVQMEQVEVIVCTEMLEHDTAPWQTLTQMREVIEPEGLLLLTARGYGKDGCYPVHDVCYDPHQTQVVGDYWRFSVDGIRRMLIETGWEPVEVVPDSDPDRPGVFAVARAA